MIIGGGCGSGENQGSVVLITGIRGFIAKNLFNHLCSSSSYTHIYGTTREESTRIIEILNDIQPDIIYHFGAEIYDEEQMFESNVVLTHTILEWARQRIPYPPKRIVLIGSSSEYGRKREPMSETDMLEPDTIYEGTKAACTMLARCYSHTYKIPILVIRPFTIYGLGEKSRKFFQILLNKIAQNDSTISISCGCAHDYVYIDDFIEAVCALVENTSLPHFDIVNIGSGVQTSNEEVVDIFERVFDYKFETRIETDAKPYDSNFWVCNTHKLKSIFPLWNPRSLNDGIETLKSLLKNDKNTWKNCVASKIL